MNYFITIEELYSEFVESPIISTDTRSIAKGSIFFALKGESFNGNTFALKALELGARLVVVDEVEYCINEKVVLVNSVLESLQQLAKYHRKHLTIPIIGITGSNGKTTSKELIAAVLEQKYKLLATKGNLNNHIGVPLTILSIQSTHEIAVIEMGANHPGEIAILCDIAEPTCGIITNIGKAHLEGFGSLDGVKKTKGELFAFLAKQNGTIFYNNDNENIKDILPSTSHISYALYSNAQIRGAILTMDPYVSMLVSVSANKSLLNSKLIGIYNAENILAAITIGHFFNVDFTQSIKAIEAYTPSNNRSQLMATNHNQIIMDAYNANPSSMDAALSNFNQITMSNKVVIIGDMLELGNESKEEHLKIIRKLSEMKNVDEAYLIGPIFHSIDQSSYHAFISTDSAKEYLLNHKLINKTILLKGSRGIKLEQLLDVL